MLKVPKGTSNNMKILRTDSSFCFYCFYFFTVLPEGGNAQYDMMVQKSRDQGEEAEEIEINKPSSDLNKFTLSKEGDSKQFKFILESKKDFLIKIFVTRSKADITIGLYPENGSDFIWSESTSVNTKEIYVDTSDPNFYIGAYYYIKVTAVAPNSDGHI